jgi:hypothetical protein
MMIGVNSQSLASSDLFMVYSIILIFVASVCDVELTNNIFQAMLGGARN